MGKTFNMVVTEVRKGYFSVEAEDIEEAMAKMEACYQNDGIYMDTMEDWLAVDDNYEIELDEEEPEKHKSERANLDEEIEYCVGIFGENFWQRYL